jgi:hypothetical protein
MDAAWAIVPVTSAAKMSDLTYLKGVSSYRKLCLTLYRRISRLHNKKLGRYVPEDKPKAALPTLYA